MPESTSRLRIHDPDDLLQTSPSPTDDQYMRKVNQHALMRRAEDKGIDIPPELHFGIDPKASDEEQLASLQRIIEVRRKIEGIVAKEPKNYTEGVQKRLL